MREMCAFDPHGLVQLNPATFAFETVSESTHAVRYQMTFHRNRVRGRCGYNYGTNALGIAVSPFVPKFPIFKAELVD